MQLKTNKAESIKNLARNNRAMMKILVADDAIHIRSTIEVLLKKHECEVDCVEDGQKAIDLFSEKKHDYILLDLNMPVVDGIEALKEMIKIKPDAKICIISAQSNPNVIKQTLELGASGYITKPFKKEDIIQKIEEITGTKLELSEEAAIEKAAADKSQQMLMDLKAQIIEEMKARYS